MGTTVKLKCSNDTLHTQISDTPNPNPCLSHEGYYNGRGNELLCVLGGGVERGVQCNVYRAEYADDAHEHLIGGYDD